MPSRPRSRFITNASPRGPAMSDLARRLMAANDRLKERTSLALIKRNEYFEEMAAEARAYVKERLGRERVAQTAYETEEKLRADDDHGSPWTPWNRQTSHRERRIAYG